MYAVFQSGGKQYQVINGQILYIEKLNIEQNSIIEFNKILMIVNKEKEIILGNPFINSSKIQAKVLINGKYPKIKIIKFKRRKHYRKSQGHRQYFTKIKILNIHIN